MIENKNPTFLSDIHPFLRQFYTPNFAKPYNKKKAKEQEEMIEYLKSIKQL